MHSDVDSRVNLQLHVGNGFEKHTYTYIAHAYTNVHI